MKKSLYRIFFTVALTLIVCITTVAQGPYRTRTFGFDWRNLQVYVEDNPLAPPVITMGEANRIVISLDLLAEDVTYLDYKIVHCDANWMPSQLSELEYLDGMNYQHADDYAYSTNTFAHYVNYRVSLPNEHVQFTKSGNYVVLFTPENSGRVVAQACFSVAERKVDVAAYATSRTDIGYNDMYQQVEFVIAHPYFNIQSPFNDLKVVVSQNGRHDNEVTVTRPLRVMSNEIYFEHNRDLIFDAGNEYRRFETVSVTYPGMNVVGYEYYEPYYHALLNTDFPRCDMSYIFDQTQHGRYVVRESNAEESDLEADYIATHFALATDKLHGGNVYIDGELTHHLYDENSIMTYNEQTQQYENVLLLKQGSYNYMYVFVPDGSTRATLVRTEGNYYPTINEYLIKVYHRPPGSRYDRLIGTAVCYSGK
ncbi:MAG: DUF5103 domain-containing protein [Bacteroidaceae bacterium]|nr:DUF5103 domain-containing protein [Bacteroidaceae bacterium]